MYFFNHHFEIYHFTLFYKPVIEILTKRTVVINIDHGQYSLNFDCLENIENNISNHLNFKIFWSAQPPPPQGAHAYSARKVGGISNHLNFKIFWGAQRPPPHREVTPSALEK